MGAKINIDYSFLFINYFKTDSPAGMRKQGIIHRLVDVNPDMFGTTIPRELCGKNWDVFAQGGAKTPKNDSQN